jgi:nucleotide-binding universal stress UspA family protein
MNSFKNVLIPTDFSKNSSLAYEFSLNFIKKSSAALHIIHVIEPLFHSYLTGGNDEQVSFDRDRVLEAEEELERFINAYSNSGIEINRIIKTGKAHEEILKYTKSSNIDLIIIATHGWTNLSHLLAGNVTKKILKFSEVPVICVKTNVYHGSESVPQENLAENWVG